MPLSRCSLFTTTPTELITKDRLAELEKAERRCKMALACFDEQRDKITELEAETERLESLASRASACCDCDGMVTLCGLRDELNQSIDTAIKETP
jgi:hypothetical protein